MARGLTPARDELRHPLNFVEARAARKVMFLNRAAFVGRELVAHVTLNDFLLFDLFVRHGFSHFHAVVSPAFGLYQL